MVTLPRLISSAAKHTFRHLRESTYDSMAHQASDWTPENNRSDKKSFNQPIKIDFAVSKKHRLAWIRRTIQHLPN